MASGPDLFVVCKNCQSQVSPYVTECPYCGQRVRKRAPKIEREGAAPARERRRRRSMPTPRLPPLRSRQTSDEPRGEGPAWVTRVFVAVAIALFVVSEVAFDRFDLIVTPAWQEEPWRLATAPLVHFNAWYGFAALFTLAIFGWLLERREGRLVVLGIILLAGPGGMAVAGAVDPVPLAAGAAGPALALLVAWAMPDVLRRRRGEESGGWDDADLLGAGVLAVLLLLLPVVVDEASVLAEWTGVLVGVVAGALLARRRR